MWGLCIDSSSIMTEKDIRWNNFIEDICYRKVEELSQIQKDAFLCFWYDAEMNSGGHSGYFDCYPETIPEELVSALITVAKKEFADNYLKAIECGEDDGYIETDNCFFAFEPTLTDYLMAYVEEYRDAIFD